MISSQQCQLKRTTETMQYCVLELRTLKTTYIASNYNEISTIVFPHSSHPYIRISNILYDSIFSTTNSSGTIKPSQSGNPANLLTVSRNQRHIYGNMASVPALN